VIEGQPENLFGDRTAAFGDDARRRRAFTVAVAVVNVAAKRDGYPVLFLKVLPAKGCR